MPGDSLIKALGLLTSPNILTEDPGGLLQASNVIIKRNNVIEPRRGFKLYGNSFGTLTDRAKQLMTYQQRIIAHFSDQLIFDTGTKDEDGNEVFDAFNGSYTEPKTGRRIRFIEANENLYFTTNNGIKKISASSASQFTTNAGFITQAGGIKALDLTARLNIVLGNITGWFPQDSAVAYRVVWGINDANKNLILGTPSQRFEIFNPLLNLLLMDYMRILGALDDIGAGVTADTNLPGTLIDNKNYVQDLGLDITASAGDLQSNLISLAAKLDADIKYADTVSNAPLQLDTPNAIVISSGVATVTFASGTATDYFVPGSNIFLSGFSPATGSVNGPQVVTTVGASTITFNTSATDPVGQTSPTITSYEYGIFTPPAVPAIPPTDDDLTGLQNYLNEILKRLQSENSNVISTPLQTEFITPINLTTTTTTILDITIPQGVTLNHFYQIYRSDLAQATGTTVLSTQVFPDDEMKLVYENFPTQAQLDAGIIEVEDIVLDTFRGANLYTNPESGEGILQANDLPPFALDINRFKNVVFYANTQTRHRLNLNLLGVSNMVTDYNNSITPRVNITDKTLDNTYDFIVGKAQVTDVTVTAGSMLNSSGPASYWLLNSANDLDKYYVWYEIGTATDPMVSGRTGIRVLANTSDADTDIAFKTAATLSRVIQDFSVSSSLAVVTVTNVNVGYTTEASAGTTSFLFSVTITGQGEKVAKESTNFTLVAGSTLNSSGSGNYFTINAPFDKPEFYVWYQVGTSTDPAITGKTGIMVSALTSDSASQVATKTATAISALSTTFKASAVGSTLTVTNFYPGPATDATTGTMPGGFSATVTQQGALQVLLANELSPSQSVDETARSFVRVINRNSNDAVYAYYISGAQDVPGKMLMEARVLNQTPIYFLGNNANTGTSFSPILTPDLQISSIATGASSTITTVTPHGLVSGDQIQIAGSNSLPNADGFYTVTVTGLSTFTIPFRVNTSGNTGGISAVADLTVTDNEAKVNRVYYSKFLQPDAVPIVNNIDVGSENKAILRIFPLRDSLFVFKEDGLWRISGETAPWSVDLFDSSVILVAPDSVDVSNNLVYSWTTKGIQNISESGANLLSQVIDIDILPKATPNFPNFSSATWGIGYESDNSYIVFTTANPGDEVGTIGYRYSDLTNTWTTFNKSNTCGVVHPTEFKLYLGAGDTNFIEQERKTFSRLDYADREISTALLLNNLLSSGQQNLYLIKLTDITTIKPGDVLIQNQLLTCYEFNTLLQKLDLDPGTGQKDYFSTLAAKAGDDLRTDLVALATHLDADPNLNGGYVSLIQASAGSISNILAQDPAVIVTSSPHNLETSRWVRISGSNSTPSIDGVWQITKTGSSTFTIPTTVLDAGTAGSFTTIEEDFRDIVACYNLIIDRLNTDTGTVFKNYIPSTTTTIQESIITGVNPNTNVITLNVPLPYVIGPLTIFSSIISTFTFRPHTFGDPLTMKHVRECQLLFENTAFTNAILAFASDLFPNFRSSQFSLKGNGIFGSANFGTNFFGGTGNAIPHRTYVPRDYQRCRYLNLQFQHQTARESYAFLGYTLTAETGLSSRAYRS